MQGTHSKAKKMLFFKKKMGACKPEKYSGEKKTMTDLVGGLGAKLGGLDLFVGRYNKKDFSKPPLGDKPS